MAQVRKAISAAVLAFLATLAGSWTASGTVGWGEVLAAVGAGVVAGLAVYTVPNEPEAPKATGGRL